MPRADAHLHLFADGYPGRYGRSPAGGDEFAVYQTLRREHGIDRALVVGYEGEPGFAGNNAHLARLAAEHDWIAPLAYLPATGTDRNGLDRLRTAGFVGVAAYLPDPASADAFADWAAGDAGPLNAAATVVSLNAGPEAIGRLGPALAALDGCVVLFSHLGLPGRQPAAPTPAAAGARLAPLTELAALPHVGVKVSGLYAVSDPAHDHPHAAARPFVDLLLDRFGTRRLYWGSDFSPSLDHVSFAQTLHPVGLDQLSAAEAADVFGGNLRRALDRR
ncbi:Amidohydrolase [Micromonospora sp. MW-13]|uniref:amidohydrolase family protein n=1 Tax=unclassified Micromonospora TaxID=2617518 RepID=UPI000E43408C|nr:MULTISPECIES: amidohydrolase family protein [unclassified Micromonospora]MCX4471888.1 amidohydrolase family protein [Micromonospora sp. NBC_01655]RGC65908.1 Amidohydrolase [Micromonospora sp. MW-13]